MSSRPIIAVSVGAATDPVPYTNALERAGAEPRIYVPNGEEQTLPDDLSGIVFCGGAAVHPSRFGQDLDPNIKKAVDEPRDAMEWAFMAQALQRGLPILGICRGFQMINVYLGGTLSQNLAAEGWRDNHRPDGPRDMPAHKVVTKGGQLQHLLEAEPFEVNSIHRQGIKALAPVLSAQIFTEDGLIEGYEAEALNIIGVQWHPEEMRESRQSKAIISSFVERCQARAA